MEKVLEVKFQTGFPNLRKCILLVLFLFMSSSIYAQITSLNVIMTRDSAQIDSSFYTIYPKAGMGSGTSYGTNDWTYDDPSFQIYVVISGSQQFLGADLTIQWDTSMVRAVNVKPGDLLLNYFFDTTSLGTDKIRINISSLAGNVSPVQGKHLLKLNAKIKKPGKNYINIINSSVRYYDFDNDIQYNVPLTLNTATIKFYLGDFATSRIILNTGDGMVNFHDAAIFGQSYNTSAGNQLFKAKFDIAPTPNGDYWSLPVGDGVIDFQDLTLLTVGYINQGSGNLLFKNGISTEPISISRNIVQGSIDELKMPVQLSGNTGRLSVISLTVICDNSYYEYSGFENPNNVFIACTKNGQNLIIDAADFNNRGNLLSGNFVNIIFKKKITSGNINAADKIKILSADAINNSGEHVNINIK